MSHMKVYAVLVSFLLLFGMVSVAVPAYAYAVTTPTTAPSISFTYTLKPRQFSVRIRNIKQVVYTITYKRTGNKLTEALTGGGRGQTGTYTRTHFAGSQSSTYAIPHTVLSGTINLSGIDINGNNVVYKKNFVIRNGKLVYTK